MTKLIASLLILLGITTNSFTVDIFNVYTAEGFVAYSINTQVQDEQVAHVDVKDCKCNGSGKVLTGDGINVTECPCGPNCTCKQTQTPAATKNRVLLFTSSKGCSFCRKLENKTFPVLKKASTPWKIGPEETNHIQVLDSDIAITHDMFEKWNVDAIPTMILIDKDNKEIRRNTGFINAKEFGTFFYGK